MYLADFLTSRDFQNVFIHKRPFSWNVEGGMGRPHAGPMYFSLSYTYTHPHPTSKHDVLPFQNMCNDCFQPFPLSHSKLFYPNPLSPQTIPPGSLKGRLWPLCWLPWTGLCRQPWAPWQVRATLLPLEAPGITSRVVLVSCRIPSPASLPL